MPELSILPISLLPLSLLLLFLLCAGPSPRVLLGLASYFLFPLALLHLSPHPHPRPQRKSRFLGPLKQSRPHPRSSDPFWKDSVMQQEQAWCSFLSSGLLLKWGQG